MPTMENTNKAGLEKAIDNLLAAMSQVSCETTEHAKMTDQVVKLYNLKAVDHKIEEITARVKESDAKIAESSARVAEIQHRTKETDAKVAESQARVEEIKHRAKETDAKVAESEARLAETNLKIEELDRPKKVSPDTVALVASNLAGILLILGYERANVLTSKALGFVTKLR